MMLDRDHRVLRAIGRARDVDLRAHCPRGWQGRRRTLAGSVPFALLKRLEPLLKLRDLALQLLVASLQPGLTSCSNHSK